MREIRTSGSVEGPGRVISLVYSTQFTRSDMEYLTSYVSNQNLWFPSILKTEVLLQSSTLLENRH